MADLLTHAERVAVARLHAVLEVLPTALDQRLAPAGITSFEFTLLEALSARPDHLLRLSTLAAKTNATLPRLSRVVSSLERKGYVERRTCPADARATNAFLTPAGEECFVRSRALYAEATRALILDGLAGLPGDGVAQLADLCLAILGQLDPDGKLAVTCAEAGLPEPSGLPEPDGCPADPPVCPADPEPTSSYPDVACPADPSPHPMDPPVCPADPEG